MAGPHSIMVRLMVKINFKYLLFVALSAGLFSSIAITAEVEPYLNQLYLEVQESEALREQPAVRTILNRYPQLNSYLGIESPQVFSIRAESLAAQLSVEGLRDVFAHLQIIGDSGVRNRLMAQGLRSDDEDIRFRAELTLLEPRNRSWVQANQSSLIDAIDVTRLSDHASELLGTLNLPANVRSELLGSRETPDYVKGRLGDFQAESRVIGKFRAAPVAGKRSLVHDLFYMDTPGSWLEFARALESEESYIDPHGTEVSQTFALIWGYNQYYPEVELFQPAMNRDLISTTDSSAVRAYLQRVEQYISETHGLQVKTKVDFLTRKKNQPHEYLSPKVN